MAGYSNADGEWAMIRIIIALILLTPGLVVAQEELSGQLSIGGGTASGLHVDADVSANGIGAFIERGVGTAGKELTGPAQAYVTIVQSGTSDAPSLLMSSHNTTNDKPGVIVFRHSRGTYATPTETQVNDVLGTILWEGEGSGSVGDWGAGDVAIESYARATFGGATARGTLLSFYQRPSGVSALQRWDLGWSSMTGHTTGLPTSATTVYFPVSSYLAANATVTTTGLQTPSPGPIHVFAATCGLEGPAGNSGTDAHAFQLMGGTNGTTVKTGVLCTITQPAVSCNVRVTGVAVGDGELLSWRDTSVNSPTATTGTCTLYFTVDAW